MTVLICKMLLVLQQNGEFGIQGGESQICHHRNSYDSKYCKSNTEEEVSLWSLILLEQEVSGFFLTALRD